MHKRMCRGKMLRAVALLCVAAALCIAVPTAEEVTSMAGELRWKDSRGAENGLSAGEMAQGYVNGLMYPDRASRAVRNMGARLTGSEARAYQKLKAMIPDIAAGRRASTAQELALEEILEKTEITAQELGVSALFVNGAITEEAVKAIQEAVEIDIYILIDALVEDMPYELYWFDKTKGISIEYSVSYSYTSTRIRLGGSIRMSMAVAQEFAADDLETVDTAWGKRAQAAAQNAQNIVKNNSGLGDLDKLYAYKTAICDLADYYDTPGSTPYGNPWQLIWVFDGDPATKVFCEGYSKAFKYLCDLSVFQGKITVGTAAGLMVTSFGSSGHMWNIVQMNDGFNYLADLTNCDTGHSGYPDLLFLKGYASGDMVNGYKYTTNTGYILYVYDQQATGLYYASELKMSSTDYQDTGSNPTAAPTLTPTPKPTATP
ncbi:MAG: hypothetical protein IKX21_01185, partial [Deltaproteobacteria bacterium]|nr:hypothetical protein [Deltaproteobacteria bacterium]